MTWLSGTTDVHSTQRRTIMKIIDRETVSWAWVNGPILMPILSPDVMSSESRCLKDSPGFQAMLYILGGPSRHLCMLYIWCERTYYQCYNCYGIKTLSLPMLKLICWDDLCWNLSAYVHDQSSNWVQHWSSFVCQQTCYIHHSDIFPRLELHCSSIGTYKRSYDDMVTSSPEEFGMLYLFWYRYRHQTITLGATFSWIPSVGCF